MRVDRLIDAPRHAPRTITCNPGQSWRILIVEDEPDVARVLEIFLLGKGFEVRKCLDVVDAIDTARSWRPHLVTLDLMMPHLDGKELASILKADPQTKDIPILVISVVDDPKRIEMVDADAYIKKPIDQHLLSDTIDRVLEDKYMSSAGKTILIASRKTDLIETIRSALDEDDFRILEVHDTKREVVSQADISHPHVVIFDLVGGNPEEFEILARLRTSQWGRNIPVILLLDQRSPGIITHCLRMGADDFITSPITAAELRTRVTLAILRGERQRATNPTTGLPGSDRIERELKARVSQKDIFAVCVLDIDDFKAFNDKYGFSRGDAVIRQTAGFIIESVRKYGTPDDFVGHIGGDDFVIVTRPHSVDSICKEVIDLFDRITPLHYDEEDRNRGYMVGKDRKGREQRFGLMSLSIGVVTNEIRRIDHFAQIADISAEVKTAAKECPGSCYVKDRRTR
jgi:diguanylate cyclase (GGDEF)-like protein